MLAERKIPHPFILSPVGPVFATLSTCRPKLCCSILVLRLCKHFIHSRSPYDIIMGDFDDDIWTAAPTHPWQEGLDDASLLNPGLATPHHPEAGCTIGQLQVVQGAA